MRPPREQVSESSLVLMGVPKRFCKYTLADFKTAGGNPILKTVKNLVKEYLEDIHQNAEDGMGICFMGSNGVGKSMLSCIILKEFYRNRYSCQRVTFSRYISEYTNGWGASKEDRDVAEQSLLERYKSVEFLVLEEIGKEIDSRIAKPILEDLLRYREEHSLVTVICTNLSPENLREMYGASVCSLINGNMTTISITSDDYRRN